MNFADNVKETTTGTSAAVITLAGAAAKFRTFADAFTVGTTEIPVRMQDDAGNWESGWYTLTDAATLTRTSIAASSNDGAATVFPDGAKEVFCTLHEGVMDRLARIDAPALSAIGTPSSTLLSVLVGGEFRAVPAQALLNLVPASTGGTGGLDPADVGFDIVLCAGQSNMAGRGTYDALIDAADGRVWQWGCDSAQTAYYRKIFSGADPLHMAEGIATGKTGPATSFARTYAASIPTNRRVLLLPLAEGGTALVGGSTPKWAPGNPGGTRYENAITQANLAITAARAIYPNSRVVGTIWVQGENDAINNVSQSAYAAALKALIAGFRARISGAANSWFVIGGMVPEQIANFPTTYNPIVAAHQQVATETDKCAYVPGPAGFAATGDQIHYKSEGSRILGARMALAVQAAKTWVGVPGGGADVDPPQLVSAAVQNAAPSSIVLSMSESLDPNFVPTASAFTVGGHAVSAVAVSGLTVILTVATPFVFGEAVRAVDYVQPASNGVRDVAGNLLNSFSGVAITNNVAAADTTAPAVSSAVVSNAVPSDIVVTFSETLAAFTPDATAFAVSGGRTVTGVARSGSTLTLTVSSPIVNGEVVTFSYTKPGSNQIQDAAGNQTNSFTGQTVTNNVAPPDTTAPTFVSAQVANGAKSVVVLTMSEALAASSPPASAFALSGGKTATAVSISGAVVSVTANTAYAYGDTITVSYVQPGANPRLQDAAGNATTNFGPVTVTNNIAVPFNGYNFEDDALASAPAGMTVTAGTLEVTDTGVAGWTGKYMRFNGAKTTSGAVYRAALDNIPSSADRTVTWKRGASPTGQARDAIVLRVGAGSASGVTGARHGYAFQTSGFTGELRIYKFSNSAAATLGTAVTLADAATRYFRASAIGTTLKFEYSADGVNWTTAVETTDGTYTGGTVDYINGFSGNTPSAAYIDEITWS